MIKLKDKTRLIDALHRETYDQIVISSSGSWTRDIGRMAKPSELILSRSQYYDITRRKAAELVKAAELYINGDYSGMLCWTRKEVSK